MSKPVRILQLSGRMKRAGAETFLMNVYRGIDRSRFQFDFVGFEEGEGDFDAEIKSLGGRIIRLPADGFARRLAMLDRFLAASPSYAIAHAHLGLSSAWLLAVCARHGVDHRWMHSHSQSFGPSIARKPYRMLSRAIARRVVTRRLACTKGAARAMFGTDANVEILPNAIDVQRFRPAANVRTRVRRDFQISGSDILVLHVGRLETVKNHEFTLALGAAVEAGERIRIMTVGTGPREGWLVGEIAARGLGGTIVHAGSRDDVADLMRAADVMILPSHHEGFPLVLVEAQAAGLPTIISEAVDPEVDLGLGLVERMAPRDPERWLEAIRRFAARPVPEFAARAARLEELGFDAKGAARRYEILIERDLGGVEG